MKTVKIVDFDPKLLYIYKEYEQSIKEILPNADIELIGSAAVPMIGKKDEIDIMVLVDNIDEALATLLKNGYEGIPKESEGLTHLKDKRKGIEADIHLTKQGSKYVEPPRKLRDTLKNDLIMRQKMIELKRSLDGKSIDEYREKKKPLIKQILEK